MAKYYVLGNWKSNGTAEDVENFRENFPHPEPHEDLSYGLALPYHLLHLADHFGAMFLGGQDVSMFGPGAFTGEISAEMLKEASCAYSLVGHSERRQYFGETVKTTAKKMKRLLEVGLFPVFCIGETLEEREAGLLPAVIRDELTPIHGLPPETRFAVAYEPVWAIGTGQAAQPADVKQAHFIVKRVLSDHGFGHIPVLYGGSVKPNNARELGAIAQLDGFLVGGASLKPENFGEIVHEFIAAKFSD